MLTPSLLCCIADIKAQNEPQWHGGGSPSLPVNIDGIPALQVHTGTHWHTSACSIEALVLTFLLLIHILEEALVISSAKCLQLTAPHPPF